MCGRDAQVYGEYVTAHKHPKWKCACGSYGEAWQTSGKIELVVHAFPTAYQPPPNPRRDMHGLLREPLHKEN